MGTNTLQMKLNETKRNKLDKDNRKILKRQRQIIRNMKRMLALEREINRYIALEYT